MIVENQYCGTSNSAYQRSDLKTVKEQGIWCVCRVWLHRRCRSNRWAPLIIPYLKQVEETASEDEGSDNEDDLRDINALDDLPQPGMHSSITLVKADPRTSHHYQP